MQFDRKMIIFACFSSCMLILGAAVSLHIDKCHNVVFLICWFGLLLCLLELCCRWTHKGKAAASATERHLRAPLCAGRLFLCLLVAHGFTRREGQGQREQNKQSTIKRCIANGEKQQRSAVVILLYVWVAWRDMWAAKGLHVQHHFPALSCKLSRLCRESVLQLIA